MTETYSQKVSQPNNLQLNKLKIDLETRTSNLEIRLLQIQQSIEHKLSAALKSISDSIIMLSTTMVEAIKNTSLSQNLASLIEESHREVFNSLTAAMDELIPRNQNESENFSLRLSNSGVFSPNLNNSIVQSKNSTIFYKNV